MTADSHTMEVAGGESVTVRPIKPVGEDVVRVDIEADGLWRLDITRDGEIDDVVVTRDAEGNLADRDLPEWIDEVTAKFAQF